MRILWNNLVDETGTLISPSSADITAENIRTQNRRRIWRTASKTNETLTIDLGDPTIIVTCCAFTGYNLTASANVLLECSTDNVSYDTIAAQIVGTGKCVFFFFALQQKRFWRLTFNDPTNTDPHIEVGRVFLGQYLELAENILPDWSFHYIDPSEVQYSIGRQKWTSQKPTIAQITFHFSHLKGNVAINGFLNMVRRVGIQQDCFALLFPDKTQETHREAAGLYGRFVNILGVVAPSQFIYDTQSVVFQETP